MIEPNIAMVIASCDSFEDVANYFFLFKKHFMPWWKYKTYYIVENKDIKTDGVITLKTGNDVNWTFRMKRALEKIQEEYLLFLLDDYYIGNPISEIQILEAYHLMESEKLRYYKFNNRPMIYGINKQYKNYEYLLTIPNNVRYGIVLGEGIYRRDFFYEILGDEDKSIWRVETDRLYGIENNNGHDIFGCVIDKRNIFTTYNGVLKGKWIPQTLRHFKKIGLPIDTGKRDKMKWSASLTRQVYGFADKYLSSQQVRFLKKIASRIGFKFVTLW